MDKQREKLIELINKGQTEYYNSFGNNGIRHNEYIADYLLANGVIVPSVGLNQTVYIVSPSTKEVLTGKVVVLEHNSYSTPKEWITVRYEHPLYGTQYKKNRLDLIVGKYVFLTKEDAEKALKGVE